MPQRPFVMEIYRLNVIDDESFDFMGNKIVSDAQVLSILEISTNSDLDIIVERGRAASSFNWCLREYFTFDSPEISPSPIAGITLAKYLVQQEGVIVTNQGIEIGVSTPDRTPGFPSQLIFFMERHLVAVEYNSKTMQSQAWRGLIHSILDKASTLLNFRSRIRLEPIARDAEILRSFESFGLLTQLKVHIRLPNPDLTRYTQDMAAAMRAGRVRDWSQDIKNRDGLSQEPGQIPQVMAAMADTGYKEGKVKMVGEIDGVQTTIVAGQNAEKISIDHKSANLEEVRILVRGLSELAKTQEAKGFLKLIKDRVERKVDRERDQE